MHIELSVSGQRMRREMGPGIVGGSRYYLTAHVAFAGHDWDGAQVWLRIDKNGAQNAYLLDEAGCVTADRGINLPAGQYTMSLLGLRDEVRITTNEVPLCVLQSGADGGDPLPEVPQTAAEQIALLAQEAANTARSVREDADAGDFNGAPGKDGVSAEHRWDGSVLTITSASGTSSADLRGPQGPKGPEGKQGPQGQAGKDAPQDAVRYGVQALDEAQQAQARANIGAGSAGELSRVKDDLTKLIKKSDKYELFSLEDYTGYTKELRKSQAGHTYIAIFTKYSGIVSIRNLVNGSWKEMSPVMTVDTCLCELTVTANGSIRVNAGNLKYNGEVYFFDVTGDPELQSYLEINGLSGVDKVISGNIYDIENDIEKINKKLDQITQNNKCVCCWGDSLTQGAPVYGVHTYPAKLANLLGNEYTVMEYGVGGETPHAILARMGAYATYAEPFTMPASGSVDLDLKTVGLPIGWRYKGPLDKGINPVIIEGIEGTIVTTEPTSGNWVYTFTRTEAGDSMTFNRPVFVSTDGSRNNRHDISIIFIGENKDYTSDEELCDEIQCAIDYLKNNRYIVVSMHTSKQTESLTRKERIKFGEHFLYTKEYLSKYGLLDAGIEPTEDDIQAMSEGAVPPSLMSDGCHFTSDGYTIIANLVYEKGKELGYW